MGTVFELLLPACPAAVSLGYAILEEVERLEDRLTVYRETSEVSRINRLAAYQPVPVSGLLFDLLQLSATLHRQTYGAFDVTTGRLVRLWGFFRGPRRIPSAEEIAAALEVTGMQHIVLDPETRTVYYRKRGIELNLGSIGKGYALDCLTARLERAGIRSALMHCGYSSVMARGCAPGTARGWHIGLADPRDPSSRLASVWLKDRALATSAATFQHVEHEGKKLGHVLDPRSGWPAQGMLSVTVVAPRAAEADALSTAFFILGLEAAARYVREHPRVAVIALTDEPQPRLAVLGDIEVETWQGTRNTLDVASVEG